MFKQMIKMIKKNVKEIRVECSFVWEEPQVISIYSTSKAAALRKLKQLYMNGHANSPNQIKIKNVEFV